MEARGKRRGPVWPGARLIEQGDEKWGRIVDGGYFENSGATTAAEIYESMKGVVKRRGELRIQPVFIMITNNPKQCKQGAKCKPAKPARMLSEMLSPQLSILKTRNSRDSFARKNMEYLVKTEDGNSPNGLYIEFGLQNAIEKGPLPLGWVMSEAAQDVMQAELSKQLQELPDEYKRALGLTSSGAGGSERQGFADPGDDGQHL